MKHIQLFNILLIFQFSCSYVATRSPANEMSPNIRYFLTTTIAIQLAHLKKLIILPQTAPLNLNSRKKMGKYF
jgi:hypothetical protein